MNMARPYRPSYPFLATTDDGIITSSGDSSTAYTALTRMQEAGYSLRFHIDNNVWDVIHKELMGWRESSRTSVNLLGIVRVSILSSLVWLKAPKPC